MHRHHQESCKGCRQSCHRVLNIHYYTILRGTKVLLGSPKTSPLSSGLAQTIHIPHYPDDHPERSKADRYEFASNLEQGEAALELARVLAAGIRQVLYCILEPNGPRSQSDDSLLQLPERDEQC